MTARRTTIWQLPLTEVVDHDTPGATRVSINTPEGSAIYHTVPIVDPGTGNRRDARPRWIAGTFPLFPVVRLADGAPWAEANIWLIEMVESKVSPNMLTFASVADDLAAYRRYLDDEEIDWLTFPVNKRQRPTYRYSAAIKLAVQAGELSPSVQYTKSVRHTSFVATPQLEATFRIVLPLVQAGFRLSPANRQYLASAGLLTLNPVADANLFPRELRKNYPFLPTTDELLRAEGAESILKVMEEFAAVEGPTSFLTSTGQLIGMQHLASVLGTVDMDIWIS